MAAHVGMARQATHSRWLSVGQVPATKFWDIDISKFFNFVLFVTFVVRVAFSVAVRAMLAMRVNCLPVVEADGKACDILTSTDLMKIFEKIQSLCENSAPSASTAR